MGGKTGICSKYQPENVGIPVNRDYPEKNRPQEGIGVIGLAV